MAEGRRGSVLPDAAAASVAADSAPGGERRPSVSFAAALKGAKPTSEAGSDGPVGRRLSRKSLTALPATPGGQRRGSSLAAVLASTAGATGAAAAALEAPEGEQAMHPGLDRIKSFNRKKATFRTAAGGAAGRPGAGSLQFDDLCAAMDVLDERIGGALARLRSQNTAGLGAVRGLAHSKSGRLRLGGPSSTKEAPAPPLPEDSLPEGQQLVQGGSRGGTAGGGDGGEEYSPRHLLGAAAAEHPDKFLSRMRFELKEEASQHAGGFITARGRLEGNTDGVAVVQSAASPCSAGTTGPEAQQSGAQTPAAQQEQQEQQARPRRSTGVRWGATEGGLDKLGWVRNLVQFGEYKQRQQQAALGAAEAYCEPSAASTDTAAAPAALDTIGWLESGAGLRPASTAAPGTAASVPGQAAALQLARGPALRSREEAALLQSWLQDMMAQVIAQAGQPQPLPQQQSAADPAADHGSVDARSAAAAAAVDPTSAAAQLADAALWVYGMAFEELQRQVGTECSDRGALLGGMWQHVFNLVELRCSLVYESIISAIKEELQATRQRAAAAAAAAQAAEERVRESMYYSRDKFAAMEAEVKHLAQLLATAEEEVTKHSDEAALLRKAIDSQSSLRAAAEGRAAEEHRRRMDLEHRVEELEAAAAQQAAAAAAQEAELAQTRADLQRSRAEGLALAEDKARLEVEGQQLQRDYQTSEIMGLSLRERLAAWEGELQELSARHQQLQAEQATASAALLESQASLSGLQLQHESLQASAAQRAARLETELAGERASLADVRHELAETLAERAALDKALQEAGSRETSLTAQLKQLAGAHEQQMAKLRQETDGRRTLDDELQALRAGLQVTQQRLEGLGLVFASGAAHRTSAEAWRAVGPISMGRQVVSAVNQQLGELIARKAELQHELGVAKERWQTEESVRVRLQEQLLESKARESKLDKERQGLESVLSRAEAQRATLDAEVAQMRRMLQDSEGRCQASHRKAMEAANEAKRLAPLEPQAARLQDALQASQAELDRVQREVTAHQSSIRKLLDEKGTALEQLAARSQALDAAQLQIRELTAASRDRLALADAKAKLEEQLHELRQRCSATERLQSESMHQLTVARRLLADAASADERAKLAAAQQELASSKAAVSATRRESILLKDRLVATEGQLQFMERQLQVAVHAPLAAAVAAAGSGPLAASAGGASSAVVDQLKRLLETKEERIRQLERAQASLVSGTAQLKHLQGELSERDAQVAQLQAEVDATRKRLHALQEAQAKAATRDLVALAASEPALPPDVAQSLALDYARNHLRSELAWTKAKLVFVSHMATQLRAKLQAAEAERVQAEVESVCVEAFYLEQGLLEQRAFAAAFDATFVQVKRMLTSAVTTLAELRRQLVAPAAADLPRVAAQANALTAALSAWVQRFQGAHDESCQADPLAEVADWQAAILGALPAVRPTSPPPLQHVSSIIVQLYAHHLRQLPLAGPPEASMMVDNVFEAAAAFFCERRGFSREAALSPAGPVTALLAGVRSHLQQPKQLLLGRLVGLVPSGGSGSSRSLQHPAAWQLFVRLLCCLRALQGGGWDALVKEWMDSEEGVQLALQCVMDLLANLYNTDAPALLDSMRRGLVPLVRQGRRGPAVDLDAFLLVCMNEYCDGNCPISPLALPRRLTDGALASGALPAANGTSSSLAGTVSGVAAAVGLPEAFQGAAGAAGYARQQLQRNPMRKRIVNLTVAADALPLVGPPRSPPPRSRAASPEPMAGMVSGSSSPLAMTAAGTAGGSTAAPARSLQVLNGMHSLMASNPALPVGLRSSLRASAPTVAPGAAAAAAEDK
ncbi:hypothetical protein ABPG75_013413 [Micractinium tetrahymenae]